MTTLRCILAKQTRALSCVLLFLLLSEVTAWSAGPVANRASSETFAVVNGSKSAVSASERFFWGRIKFNSDRNEPDQWDAHPFGDTFLLRALRDRTSIDVDENWYVAATTNLEELCKHPFLFITADGNFRCSDQEFANLKEYVSRGGFLFADDCVLHTWGDDFFVSFKEKMENAFGTRMVKLPNDHEIYHCVYDMPNGLPHMQGKQHGGWALFIDGRMAIFLSPSDIHCGWTSNAIRLSGEGEPWFTPAKEDLSLKMGINIIVYAMTH